MDWLADDEPPLWRVWLTRIVVTAMIAFAIEYLGRQPVPEFRREEKPQQQEKRVMQYAEMAIEEKEELMEEEGAEEDGAAVTTEIPKEDVYAEEEADFVVVEQEPQKDTTEIGREERKQVGTAKPKNDSTNEATSTNTDTGSNPTAEEEEDQENAAPKTIKFRNKLLKHPGMDGYHRWYDIETSLFRQYNVGRTDDIEVIPPYVKKSRSGQVKVSLQVLNQLTDPSVNQRIKVYWINYTGHEVLKGTITRGETWRQTTYPEHPWVFRLSDTEELLVHYIPERVIPHLEEAPTIDEDQPYVGIQRFIIKRPTPEAVRDNLICSIDDKIMPHPASHHFHNPNLAHDWTLLQMQRTDYFNYNPGATLICKYLTNIAMDPANANYRHIRIANKNFTSGIWNTAARGLLLAAGFVEQHAYAELGTGEPLSSELVQDVSLVLHRLEQSLAALGQNSGSSTVQPEGADGFGRAGFGRAGQMNSRP